MPLNASQNICLTFMGRHGRVLRVGVLEVLKLKSEFSESGSSKSEFSKSESSLSSSETSFVDNIDLGLEILDEMQMSYGEGSWVRWARGEMRMMGYF